MKYLYAILNFTILSLLGCQSNNLENSTYQIKSNVANGKIQVLNNNTVIFDIEERALTRPFEPVLTIDSVNSLGYFNLFKSGIICFDLNMKDSANKVSFKYDQGNDEMKCSLTMKNECLIFSSHYNLMIFSKKLKSCFNVGDILCTSNSYCFIENIKLIDIDNDFVRVSYKLNYTSQLDTTLKIAFKASDSLTLYNFPPPSVIINEQKGIN